MESDINTNAIKIQKIVRGFLSRSRLLAENPQFFKIKSRKMIKKGQDRLEINEFNTIVQDFAFSGRESKQKTSSENSELAEMKQEKSLKGSDNSVYSESCGESKSGYWEFEGESPNGLKAGIIEIFEKPWIEIEEIFEEPFVEEGEIEKFQIRNTDSFIIVIEDYIERVEVPIRKKQVFGTFEMALEQVEEFDLKYAKPCCDICVIHGIGRKDKETSLNKIENKSSSSYENDDFSEENRPELEEPIEQGIYNENEYFTQEELIQKDSKSDTVITPRWKVEEQSGLKEKTPDLKEKTPDLKEKTPGLKEENLSYFKASSLKSISNLKEEKSKKTETKKQKIDPIKNLVKTISANQKEFRNFKIRENKERNSHLNSQIIIPEHHLSIQENQKFDYAKPIESQYFKEAVKQEVPNHFERLKEKKTKGKYFPYEKEFQILPMIYTKPSYFNYREFGFVSDQKKKFGIGLNRVDRSPYMKNSENASKVRKMLPKFTYKLDTPSIEEKEEIKKKRSKADSKLKKTKGRINDLYL